MSSEDFGHFQVRVVPYCEGQTRIWLSYPPPLVPRAGKNRLAFLTSREAEFGRQAKASGVPVIRSGFNSKVAPGHIVEEAEIFIQVVTPDVIRILTALVSKTMMASPGCMTDPASRLEPLKPVVKPRLPPVMAL